MKKTPYCLRRRLLPMLTVALVGIPMLTAVGNPNRVPGHALNHKTEIINPVPRGEVRSSGTLDISGGFAVKDKKHAISNIPWLKTAKKGVPLIVTYGEKAARKAGVKETSGAYRLVVNKKGVNITGFDEKGAWYGLQTLRQLIEQNAGRLPITDINDWPALKYRGVVEGFYGTPWSHATRLSLIDFMGRNKMNSYIYGPKDDPYHRTPSWRLPYPEAEAAQIRELIDACHRNHIDFVWAIHPGGDIRWNREDYDSLLNKFNAMYNLGVRQFALFFDDISGVGTDSHRQTALINDLTRDFVRAKGDVGNLMICPTDYTRSWASPSEKGQLATYGRELLPEVDVFWTGDAVCGDIDAESLEWVGSRIRRPALVWWNYPVTDYCRNFLLQGPVYGLDTTLTSANLAGIESNPMEHGEASKLAIYGVADWGWNPAGYNALDTWERGLKELLPDAADAYRTFAIHSADTRTGYRRDESWETDTFSYTNYTPAQYDALYEEFTKISEAPGKIFASKSNPALVEELRPWLEQFVNLGGRGIGTLKLIKTFETGNDSLFWCRLRETDISDAQRKEFDKHISGTLRLLPFIENNISGMRREFFTHAAGRIPDAPVAIFSRKGVNKIQSDPMIDGDTATYYHSGHGQVADEWVGLDMQEIKPLHEISIIQGRNEGDCDFYDLALLETSADGKTWTTLGDTIRNTYNIHRTFPDVLARYVRLRRLPESERTNWTSVKEFVVNPLTVASIGLNLTSQQPVETLIPLFDNNPVTSAPLNGSVTFDRIPDAETLLVLSAEGPMEIIQTDSRNRTLVTSASSSPYLLLPLNPKTRRVTVKATKDIFDIIQKK